MSSNSLSLLSILGIIFIWSVVPRSAVISSIRSKGQCHEGVFTREIRDCELVFPHRANNDGTFLSYSLPQFYQRKLSRRKREIPQGDQKTHYVMTIEGVPHHVELWPNHGMMSPNLVIEHRSPNISEVKAHLAQDQQCHYAGHVRGHEDSRASLSVCDGLAGYVRVGGNHYYIEPAKASKPKEDGQHLHLVYRASDHNVNASERTRRRSNCDSGDNWERDWRDRLRWELEKDPDFFKHSIHRRRESKHRYVETCIVADKKFITYHKDRDIENYVLTLFNMVTTLYHDNSIGNPVDVVLTRIIYLEKEEEEIDLEISRDAGETLVSFCEWIFSFNPKDDDHPHHFDVAVLLTRHDICSDNMKKCSLIGLAFTAAACKSGRGCSINEDTGLLTGNTISHEMGHNLGCTHDIPERVGCSNQAPDKSYYVMSPYVMMNTNSWSSCSRKYMTTFFDTGLGDCLLNEPVESNFKIPDMPPGAMYDWKYQCQERFGKHAEICPITGEKICRQLLCKVGKSCVGSGVAPADGTKCGEDKWCFGTKCVEAGRRYEAIHGHWGSWGPWSPCTRTCGGGIEFQERDCDNPKPEHRGRYCVGERRRVRICNIEHCDFSEPSFRETQCSEFDGKKNGKIWKPYWSKAENANPCELLCINEKLVVQKLETRVKDGTRCRGGTRDTCISGRCREVGCDWVLDSEEIEDECGVCNGTGLECTLVDGTFNETKDQGYETIVRIPEGSTKILVSELKGTSNRIAIVDDEGQYLLNGGKKEDQDGQYLFGCDVVGVYSHLEPNKEELLIRGPTIKPLILQALFTGAKNPGIRYIFFQPGTNKSYTPSYDWEFLEWSDCSAHCGGGIEICKAACVEAVHGLVSPGYCDKDSRPQPLTRSCNMHDCPYKWRAGDWGPCTATGQQERLVDCVKENAELAGEDIVSDPEHCKGKRPAAIQKCEDDQAMQKQGAKSSIVISALQHNPASDSSSAKKQVLQQYQVGDNCTTVKPVLQQSQGSDKSSAVKPVPQQNQGGDKNPAVRVVLKQKPGNKSPAVKLVIQQKLEDKSTAAKQVMQQKQDDKSTAAKPDDKITAAKQVMQQKQDDKSPAAKPDDKSTAAKQVMQQKQDDKSPAAKPDDKSTAAKQVMQQKQDDKSPAAKQDDKSTAAKQFLKQKQCDKSPAMKPALQQKQEGNKSRKHECPPILDNIGPNVFKFVEVPLIEANETQEISEEAEEEVGDMLSHKINFDKMVVLTGEAADNKTKEVRDRMQKDEESE